MFAQFIQRVGLIATQIELDTNFTGGDLLITMSPIYSSRFGSVNVEFLRRSQSFSRSGNGQGGAGAKIVDGVDEREDMIDRGFRKDAVA
jgi:hypothetical protein